jgi:hypothetical protein
MAHEAGRPRAAHRRFRSPERAEYELLGADPDPITVRQNVGHTYGKAAHAQTVATSEILDRDFIPVDMDSRVVPRHQRILQRHLTAGTSADYRIALGQVDLLEQKP